MTRCKSCGREIIWAKTAAGRAAPLDAIPVWFMPDDKGKEIIGVLDENSRETVVRFVRGRFDCEDPGKTRLVGYVSHFASCKNAPGHRKPRRPPVRPRKEVGR